MWKQLRCPEESALYLVKRPYHPQWYSVIFQDMVVAQKWVPEKPRKVDPFLVWSDPWPSGDSPEPPHKIGHVMHNDAMIGKGDASHCISRAVAVEWPKKMTWHIYHETAIVFTCFHQWVFYKTNNHWKSWDIGCKGITKHADHWQLCLDWTYFRSRSCKML